MFGIKNKLSSLKEAASQKIQQAKATYKLARLSRAQAGESMVSKVVGIAVALLVTATVFPIAIDKLVEVDTSSWPDAVGTLMTVLLPVLAVIGIVLYITDVDSM